MQILERAKVLELAYQRGEFSYPIIHLEVGEPDFPTPPTIIEAASKALSDGADIKYTPALGLPELRQLVADWYQHNFNLSVSASRVLITNGASGALSMLAMYLVNKHWHRGVDRPKVLMADPGYPCNRHFFDQLGAEVVAVPVGPDSNFQLSCDLIAAYWSDDAIGVILASPSNPTGTTLSLAELSSIAEFVAGKKGFLVCDEIYQGLVFDSEVQTLLELDKSAFVVSSFSKYFGMTGWRLGWMVVPEDAVEPLDRYAQNFFIAPHTLSQLAALSAFSEETTLELERRRGAFRERRDLLYAELTRLGFRFNGLPQGAFYLYANIRAVTHLASEAFCLNLLENYGVACTPGTDFGANEADDYVRFAYTAEKDLLIEACRRIEGYLAELRG